MPGLRQYNSPGHENVNIHDVLIEVADVATNLMVWLEGEWNDGLSARVSTVKQCKSENTHDKAEGEPLPSLVDFGAEVTTILHVCQSLLCLLL